MGEDKSKLNHRMYIHHKITPILAFILQLYTRSLRTQ